jgi:hypothetical protein
VYLIIDMAFSRPGMGNAAQLYHHLYDIAQRNYDSGAPKAVEEALNDCAQMLLYRDLPVMVKIRCHVLLSDKKNEDGTEDKYAVLHAETAKRLLDEELRPMPHEGGEHPRNAVEGHEFDHLRDIMLQMTIQLADFTKNEDSSGPFVHSANDEQQA